jgi:hypothetical protein
VSNFPTHSVIASNSNETGRGYPLLIKGGEWDPFAFGTTTRLTCYFGFPIPGISNGAAMASALYLGLSACRISASSRRAIQF